MSMARQMSVARQTNVTPPMSVVRKKAEKLMPATKLRMRKITLQIKRLAERRTSRMLEKTESLGSGMNLQTLAARNSRLSNSESSRLNSLLSASQDKV